MIKLKKAVSAWGTPGFDAALKLEVQNLDADLLPLQEGLSQSSYVGSGDISVVVLSTTETADAIQVKAGVFYTGIIAGSCCADDPTPVDEQTEYCEMQLTINRNTAETTVAIVKN